MGNYSYLSDEERVNAIKIAETIGYHWDDAPFKAFREVLDNRIKELELYVFDDTIKDNLTLSEKRAGRNTLYTLRKDIEETIALGMELIRERDGGPEVDKGEDVDPDQPDYSAQ
jgi:hypothetical protein